jgi:vacuolar protein sorting-associated protein 35
MDAAALNEAETFVDEATQLTIVDEFREKVDKYTFIMNRSYDLGKFDDVFANASLLVEPLETGALTPTHYYAVYHHVSTSLFALATYLTDQVRVPTRVLAEQYEVVQYHPRCLRRLYMMVIIGQELVSRRFCKTLDMLEDLLDMIRQAQDPIRALFLRHFPLCAFK